MLHKTNAIKQHLLKRGTITSWEAIDKFKLTRLAAIIHRLRESGWNIVSEQVNQKVDGKIVWYAKYKLVSAPKRAK